MKEIVREEFSDIHLGAGDSIQFSVKDDDTGEVFFRHTLPATRPMVINAASVFKVTNELGFKEGHALVAGEKDA